MRMTGILSIKNKIVVEIGWNLTSLWGMVGKQRRNDVLCMKILCDILQTIPV